ncbi:hypothetical protein [Streptomyces sp. NPDC047046]|uniref:hypothetical protein n=1 Tax=Streptomyces sp. NPDC047046 TaxID=3155378 RepID=UPI0033C79EF2
MPEITFTPLPPANSGRVDRRTVAAVEIAAQLRARPGEWALIRTKTGDTKRAQSAAQSYARTIRTGRLRAYPVGQFEARARTAESGVTHVYARYVGDAQQ